MIIIQDDNDSIADTDPEKDVRPEKDLVGEGDVEDREGGGAMNLSSRPNSAPTHNTNNEMEHEVKSIIFYFVL